LMCLIIIGAEYKLWTCSLCTFLHSVTYLQCILSEN
jgi:hypothetical protein